MNNNLVVRIKFTLFMILICLGTLSAQWRFSLATSQEYSNNPFSSPFPIASMVSSFNLGIEKDFSSLSLGYYGNYTNFANDDTRNFYWHQFGLWNLTDSTMYGFYAEQRVNTINYNYYNYSNLNAYYKRKFNFDGFTLLGNAAASYTDYSNLEDLRNILLNSGLMFNKSFETKTTLIGGVNFNYKNYVSSDLKSTELTGDSLESPSSNAFTSQLTSYLRIAQSLTESTGLALQYSNQTILGGTANFIRQIDYVYGDESQYFDDPISYQGNSLSAQLTQLFSETMFFKINFSYASKEYPSQGIYESIDYYDELKIRVDNKTDLNLSLTKYFYTGKEEQNTLLLTLSYNMINNNSNSFWYDYKSNQVSLLLNYQF
ncbi:MAG: hypothetical protein OQJ81_12035 [Melioribacteraceae bacterium]|nr:hypothetical protein [Melioribacteraceae bacterium]